MFQHSSTLGPAKPRQYLESYNRKAYVRPPTAWATAKKRVHAERSVQLSFVCRCLKIIMSHFIIWFPKIIAWETSEAILWSLLWTKCKNWCTPDTSGYILVNGEISVGNNRRIGRYRKNDDKLWDVWYMINMDCMENPIFKLDDFLRYHPHL